MNISQQMNGNETREAILISFFKQFYGRYTDHLMSHFQ